MQKFVFLYFIIFYLLIPLIVSSKEVPVLNKNLKFGDVINESNIIYLDLNDVDNNIIISDKHLIGSKAKTNIQANTPIKYYQLKFQPVIRKSEPVNIIFIKDNITLQSKGIALEDGFYDTAIKIKNLYNSKNMIAKVVDKYSVIIE